MAGKSRRVIMRFNPIHGPNIILYDDNTVAYRSASYANALTFSEKPLHPGEIFLLEIEKHELGWSGNMRLGLTQIDPNMVIKGELPEYALPDLVRMGSSWVYSIAKSANMSSESIDRYIEGIPLREKKLVTDGVNVQTLRGVIPIEALRPKTVDSSQNLLATELGSRIGVMYVPQAGSDKADMHIIINGEDQGVCEKDIPYRARPLYAVADVYGTTKQVRIVQLYGVLSLQSACRDAIRQFTKGRAVNSLPLPQSLKDYLLYRSQ